MSCLILSFILIKQLSNSFPIFDREPVCFGPAVFVEIKVGEKDSCPLSSSSPARDAVPTGDYHAVFAALLGRGCNDKTELLAVPGHPYRRTWFQQVWKETASEQRGGQSDGGSSAAQPGALLSLLLHELGVSVRIQRFLVPGRLQW